VLNAVLGNSFYWYLMVETEDRSVGKMYAKIVFRYMKKLEDVSRVDPLPLFVLRSLVADIDFTSPFLPIASPLVDPTVETSSVDKPNSWLPSPVERKSTEPRRTVERRRSRNSRPTSRIPNTVSSIFPSFPCPSTVES